MGEWNPRAELEVLFREFHCRYCGRLDEKDSMGDRCRVDVKMAANKALAILSKAEQRGEAKERERWVKAIEKYFEGLIAIPDPQATLEELLTRINKPL